MGTKYKIPSRLVVTTFVVGLGACTSGPVSREDAAMDSFEASSDVAFDSHQDVDSFMGRDVVDALDVVDTSPLCSERTGPRHLCCVLPLVGIQDGGYVMQEPPASAMVQCYSEGSCFRDLCSFLPADGRCTPEEISARRLCPLV
jgi:hypothetical protein